MALRQVVRIIGVPNRGIFTSARLNFFGLPEEYPDADKVATGLEKRELEAIQGGNEDPFDMNTLKRVPSTKDKPNLVPSCLDSRIIGCICEEDSPDIKWMWVHKGTPKRCLCGHWFQLVYKAPV